MSRTPGLPCQPLWVREQRAADISLEASPRGSHERRVIPGVELPRKSPPGQSGPAFASYLL